MVSKKRRCSSSDRADQKVAQIDAVEPRGGMGDADEAAEHAVAIGVAGEDRDPPAAEMLQAAGFPIGAALRVEMGRDQPMIGREVGRIVGRAEETIEGLPRRQPGGGDQFQPVKRHMGPAEIDGRDVRRVGGQVGEHVAAARGDGHDMAVRPERQRLEVDLGILPDLGIDQAAEQPFEQPLQQTFTGKGAMAPDRLSSGGHGSRPADRPLTHPGWPQSPTYNPPSMPL